MIYKKQKVRGLKKKNGAKIGLNKEYFSVIFQHKHQAFLESRKKIDSVFMKSCNIASSNKELIIVVD